MIALSQSRVTTSRQGIARAGIVSELASDPCEGMVKTRWMD